VNPTLFLGGGGSAEQSKPLDDELAAMFGDGRRPSCLYIPVAMDESKHDGAREWFSGTYGGFYAHIEMLSRLGDLDHTKTFDVIYIGGGNTGRLLDQIYKSRFDKYLATHLCQARLVYGGSAGAIVLGRTILTTPATEHSIRRNDGLDLLDGKAVVAHYNDQTDRANVVNMCHRLRNTLLAIPEDAGVVVDGQQMKRVGSSPVLVFEPGRDPGVL
jgi:dipeptidase E